ncbi:hypothetical protein AB0J82_18800 [Asanoa sp. NPDC049518]|uniref:hypothetical protein n=1 Tax=unclassified Asanoa TaxID=2685164 RepID=UPI00343DF1DA
MRRAAVTLTALALAVVATACDSAPVAAPPAAPAPTSAAPPPATAARPATAAVCAEAVQISDAGAKAYSRTLDELYVLARSDLDQATIDARSAEKERVLDEAVDVWADRLTKLARLDVDPPARTALLEGASTIERVNDPATPISVGEVRATLERTGRTIAASCPA